MSAEKPADHIQQHQIMKKEMTKDLPDERTLFERLPKESRKTERTTVDNGKEESGEKFQRYRTARC